MTYDEYLQHHGIPGMRWGRRNGPPYPLLRRSMSSAEKKANPVSTNSSASNSDAGKKQEPVSGVKVETPAGDKTVSNSKPVKDMSDKELNQTIDRMKKEKEYRTLASQDITKGSAWAKAFLMVSGGVALSTIAAKLGKDVGEGVYGKGKTWIKDVVDLFKNGVFDEKKKKDK